MFQILLLRQKNIFILLILQFLQIAFAVNVSAQGFLGDTITSPTPTASSGSTSSTNFLFEGLAYISSTTTDFTLATSQVNVDIKSGDKTMNASVLYIPVNTDSTQSDLYLFNKLDQVPLYDTNLTIKLKLTKKSNVALKTYYHVAILKSSDYYQTITTGTTFSTETTYTATDTKKDYNISFTTLQLKNSGSTLSFSTENSGNINETQDIYLFTSDSSEPGNFNLSSATDFQGGVFISLRFSNEYDRVGLPKIGKVSKGDQKVILSYDNGTIANTFSNTFLQTILFVFNSSQTFQSYKRALSKSIKKDINNSSTKISGNISAEELENGQTYYIGIGIVNKFQFVSLISDTVAETPKELEVVLKEQGCLLSDAGLNTPPYRELMDSLRFLRDHYLLKVPNGREAVAFYYSFSTLLSPIIKSSPLLQFFIKESAKELNSKYGFGQGASLLCLNQSSRPI